MFFNTCMYTYIYIYMYTCYICTHKHMQVYISHFRQHHCCVSSAPAHNTYTHTDTDTHKNTHVWMHTCMYMYLCTYICICVVYITHTYTCIYYILRTASLLRVISTRTIYTQTLTDIKIHTCECILVCICIYIRIHVYALCI